MENKLIKMLDSDLECMDCRIKEDTIIMDIKSSINVIECPYCGASTSRVHSTYIREIQDIPLQDKRTILLLNTRKMFCDNHECTHKTFSEPFDFVKPKAKKTNRLIDRILITSVKLSSVSAQTLLESNNIQASKSSICELLKKNAIHCG